MDSSITQECHLMSAHLTPGEIIAAALELSSDEREQIVVALQDSLIDDSIDADMDDVEAV